MEVHEWRQMMNDRVFRLEKDVAEMKADIRWLKWLVTTNLVLTLTILLNILVEILRK